MKTYAWWALGGVFFLFAGASSAERYHGRITSGGIVSKEKFKDTSNDDSTNDDALFSNRFYLNMSDWTSQSLTLVSDIRNKYDFYEKLNQEELALEGSNTLQVRQLSLERPRLGHNFALKAGRFEILEAGSAIVDGVEGSFLLSEHNRLGFFHGLNPKDDLTGRLRYQRDATSSGAFHLFQSQSANFGRYSFSANALVTNAYQGERDRLYYFNNSTLQWDSAHRLSTLLYYDFVPTAKIQNLNMNYNHQFNSRKRGVLTLSAIDTIEYRRNQGVLERLPAGPFREANFRLFHTKDERDKQDEYLVSYGKRSLDGLTRYTLLYGKNLNQLTDQISAYARIGYRDNFTTKDIFTKFGLGFYSPQWEMTFDQEVGREDHADGRTAFPLISEIGFSNFFSRQFFSSLSWQYAQDDKVQIYSILVSLTYRFGDKSIPPIREGSPVRGRMQ